mgnify:CR=1 FL=1|jgi:uncharacterized membrane protein YebE (DUF533 family)
MPYPCDPASPIQPSILFRSNKEFLMKITHRLIGLVSVALVVGGVPVLAVAQATPQIDQREAKQSARINQGAATGKLSNQEEARLRAGQAKVEGMETAAKADGHVTKSERAAIKSEQNHQSRRIAKQKHDHNNR